MSGIPSNNSRFSSYFPQNWSIFQGTSSKGSQNSNNSFQCSALGTLDNDGTEEVSLHRQNTTVLSTTNPLAIRTYNAARKTLPKPPSKTQVQSNQTKPPTPVNTAPTTSNQQASSTTPPDTATEGPDNATIPLCVPSSASPKKKSTSRPTTTPTQNTSPTGTASQIKARAFTRLDTSSVAANYGSDSDDEETTINSKTAFQDLNLSPAAIGALASTIARAILVTNLTSKVSLHETIVGAGVATVLPQALPYIEKQVTAHLDSLDLTDFIDPELIKSVFRAMNTTAGAIGTTVLASRLIDQIPYASNIGAVASTAYIAYTLLSEQNAPKTGHVHTGSCSHPPVFRYPTRKQTAPQPTTTPVQAAPVNKTEPAKNPESPQKNEASFFDSSARFLTETFQSIVKFCKASMTAALNFFSYISTSISEFFLGKEDSETV